LLHECEVAWLKETFSGILAAQTSPSFLKNRLFFAKIGVKECNGDFSTIDSVPQIRIQIGKLVHVVPCEL
jgi:hypothetical protein